ncbi:RICIN domain-containing protein [Amycolatopsis sp. NPDC058340]|uniref:RICIN domain-containing protein n=1 Tax=Amycolatopsis sp. NPDC058340 TaxID=3346453 RepID=UPI00366661B7
MTKMKRLAGIIAAAAGVLTLVTAPAATAAPKPTGEGFNTVSVHGIKLIPVKRTSTGARTQAAGVADADMYLIPSGLNPNKCWDADLNTINRNGTKMQLWDCNLNADHQAFYITDNPEGYSRFQNVASGRYLDADLNSITKNGTIVQLWDFIAGAKNQWWAGTVNPEGYVRFQSPASGRYLTAEGNSSTNGTRLQLWSFIAGGRSQWWGDTPA